MKVSELLFLLDYDRWATGRILTALGDIDEANWSTPNAIGDRGLGGILVHHLGATQRWRHGFLEDGISARLEREPLLSPEAVREAWASEWQAWESWIGALADDQLDHRYDDVPMWQLLIHVLNHGTQHRTEAAALLTEAGRSPGDLDLVDFAEARAAGLPAAGEASAAALQPAAATLAR
jgi:uncharacterized damage-inducible protein DinB